VVCACDPRVRRCLKLCRRWKRKERLLGEWCKISRQMPNVRCVERWVSSRSYSSKSLLKLATSLTPNPKHHRLAATTSCSAV